MIKSVKKFIVDNNLSGKTILVGLSGGADSSVLCDILSKIDNIKVIAIHLNHNWRGEESKRDEKFAQNFAKQRNLEFYSEKLDKSLKKTETNARELRYKFFENCKEKFNANAVFLAHNKNDNTETLIYRLIKGTGPRGLISIPKVRDFYYRPLLDFSREEIEHYAKENKVKFITDSSNLNTKYKRNLIREEILPKMKEINPNVINSISNFIALNKENQKIVDREIEASLLKIKKDDYFLRSKFLGLDDEIKNEIINRFLQGKIKTRDLKTVKKIVKFIENNSSSKISLAKNLFLKVYNDKIYIIENNEKISDETALKLGENRFLNYKIIVEKSKLPKTFPKEDENVYYLKLDFKNEYTIRTRKRGDKIVPFNGMSPQKLKDVFMKKKIPLEERDKIPLIAIKDEVLLAFSYQTSEKLRVDKNDETCYKITIEKGN